MISPSQTNDFHLKLAKLFELSGMYLIIITSTNALQIDIIFYFELSNRGDLSGYG